MLMRVCGLYLYSPSGKGVLCGHADGSIVRFTFEGGAGDLSRVSHVYLVI